MNYGRWETLEELGSGGQGTVYLAREWNEKLDAAGLSERVPRAIAECGSVGLDVRQRGVDGLLDLMRELCKESTAQKYALKVLHEFGGADEEQKARERLRKELALQQRKDSSLIRVIDFNVDGKWFVMDYYPTTLAMNLDRTKGDLLASLIAFRPIVEGVSILHRDNFVHRDIKPENIFVTGDGELVLGDFGLVFQTDETSDRVTGSYENVGSRDWMPGWAMGMRLEDVRPAFDVFSLGKVLWAMLSGKAKLPLWYHRKPEFDLSKIFPDIPGMWWANDLLDQCVVEDESNCIPDAVKLLKLVDEVVQAQRLSGQLPKHGQLRCIICGMGKYVASVREEPDFRVLACDYCGNTQSFHRPGGRRGWAKDGR